MVERDGGAGRRVRRRFQRPRNVHNVFPGTADTVVQAGYINHLHLPSPRTEPGAIVSRLARAVTIQLRERECTERIHDPVPIPVRWSTVGPPVSDHWDAIGGVLGRDDRMDLGGGLDQIATVFRRIPARRLIILGDPGAGKTVLAVRLALDLLGSWTPADPVPVVVSIASWRPDEQQFDHWLPAELIRLFPELGVAVRPGVPAATDLVAGRRLLPVLDGLDEMAAPARVAALSALRRWLGGDQPLVITCRSDVYDSAVADGQPLARAAVISLERVGPDAIAEYLRAASSPTQSHRWDSVIQRVRAQPKGPLALALSTPLMLWLARTTYEDRDRPGEPGDLVSSPVGARRQTIQAHLLGAFIPAAYAASARTGRARHWDGDRAQRWYGFLATAAGAAERGGDGAANIAWWQLWPAVPGRWFRRVVAVGWGLLLACLAASVLLVVPAHLAVLLFWSAIVVIVFGYGFVCAWNNMAGKRFRYVDMPVPTTNETWRTRVLQVFSMAAVMAGNSQDFLQAFRFPVATGDADWVARPRALLNDHRRLLLISLLAAWLVGSVLYLLFHVVLWGERVDLSSVLTVAGKVFILVLGLVARSDWFAFAAARVWLATTGRLPWRVMAFLEDGHARGVLRQNGGVYQFRHRRLYELCSAPVAADLPARS